MITKDQLPAMAKALTQDVNNVLLATTLAQHERERVDNIQRAVLAEQVYLMDEKHLQRGREDQRITEPEKAWLMNDTDAATYYAKLNAIHLAEGFERAAEGYCPALCAESLQRDAERALLDSAHEWMPELDPERMCGDLRKRGLDLLIGLVVNAPGYRAPKITPRGDVVYA